MIPAVEVLVNTARVRELIGDPKRTREIHDAITTGRDPYGMISFDQSLMDLVRRKLVTYEEALAQATNADDFALRYRGIGRGDESVIPGSDARPEADLEMDLRGDDEQDAEPSFRPRTVSELLRREDETLPRRVRAEPPRSTRVRRP